MFRGSLWLCAPNTAPGAPSPVERGQAAALAPPAVGHISASPLDASRRGEITRRASAPDAAVPRLCDPPGAEGSPWGSSRCPHNPPCLPLPSSPSRSSSEERKGPGPALRRGCPGERGGHRRRRHLPRGRASSPAAPPSGPAGLEALQGDKFGLRISTREGGRNGFPELSQRLPLPVPGTHHFPP